MKNGRQPISNDQLFLGMAFLYAESCYDPAHQMACIIVDIHNRPIGWGVNEPLEAIKEMDWSTDDKESCVLRPIESAIAHSTTNIFKDTTAFLTYIPDKRSMVAAIKHSVSRVVYYDYAFESLYYTISDEEKVVTDMAAKAGVKLKKFAGKLHWMRDRIGRLAEGGWLE